MRVAVIGGDRRMLYAAEAFRAMHHTVTVSGFEKITDTCSDVKAAMRDADIIVLPVRPVQGELLHAPFAREGISLQELGRAAGEKPVFCGGSEALSGVFAGRVYDYAAREDFAVRNAVLTAEGTVALLISESAGSVFGARVLVLGYGRIGRILCRCLHALGAEVTVAVRREVTRAWAEAEGIKTTDYSLMELNVYDMIVNTVPAPVLDAPQIDRLRTDTLLIDLASAPGGADCRRALQRGIKAIHALGLPGRIAPKAAGSIITETICNMIKEENGGKDNLGLRDDRLLLHL